MLGLSAVLLAQPILPFEWRVFMRDRSTDPVSYWDHERRHLDTLVEWARELNLPPGTTVCGDSATAPILALAADFRIALGEADTNVMRFRAGLPSPEAFILRLEEQEVDTLLVRTSPRSGGKEGLNGIFILPEFQTYMKGSFRTRATLEVDSHTKVYLLARKPRNE